MSRSQLAPHPFLYPQATSSRRHGPCGYRDYRDYRPWLRDEFSFRCAYCLSRETWSAVKGLFDLDHLQPRQFRADLTLSYENLVYACHRCNSVKGVRAPALPTAVSLSVSTDGGIHASDRAGQRMIELLSLDDFRSTNFRRMIMGTIRSLFGSVDLEDRATLRLWMGLPEDLPDLSRRSPPGGNTRPGGVAQSWHARRTRGEALPEFFER